jgi:hypothetical protein
MSKKAEIDEWREKARQYRQTASATTSVSSSRMLHSLAREAEALAEDLEELDAQPAISRHEVRAERRLDDRGAARAGAGDCAGATE